MSMIPPDEFGSEVAEYDPITLLQMCAHASKKLEQSGEIMRQGTLYGQNVVVTHHGLATVAMWAIRNYSDAGSKTPSSEDMIRLANNVYSIQDPFLGTSAGGVMTLVRAFYGQGPYQEKLEDLIPRHLLLYLETHPSYPPLDLDEAFGKATRLSVKEFIAIGVAFCAAALTHHSFERGYVENTEVESLRRYVTPDKVDAFLAVAGADFATFRRLRLEEESAAPGLGRYTFNPLVARPIIILPSGLLCLPVPRLVMYRITRGVYYDLLDSHSQPRGNPFLEWFGYAFQGYVGILLRDAFGEEKVFSEPRFGKPEKAGPDWVVLEGDAALVLECRSGRAPKVLRTRTDPDEMMAAIKRNIVHTAAKLPEKIDDLRAGRTGIPTHSVTSYVPAIVTYEPWRPVAVIMEFVRRQLTGRGVGDFEFELMSIEDLEWLLAWAQYEDPAKVLKEKRQDSHGRGLPVGQYVTERAKRKGVTTLRHKLLSDKLSEYMAEIEPAAIGSEDTEYPIDSTHE